MGAGVAITAKSIFSAISKIVEYALIPNILFLFGLIGKTVPLNGFVIKFHNKVLPTLPGFSLAPITATVLGANTLSREFILTVFKIS